MAETYTAGYVTAYGAAVRGGYTGTYEEFCAEQADFAENAAAVAQAKEDVETMQGQVEQAAATFVDTTVPAAVTTVQEAGAAQVQAVQSEGTMQAAAVETVGAQQTAAVGAAGSDAVDAVEAAETAATGAVTAAQTAAVQAVQTESATQQAAIQTKGEQTIASIPADYTALSGEVDDLKIAISYEISTSLDGWVNGYIRNTDGTIGSETHYAVSPFFKVDTEQIVKLTIGTGYIVKMAVYDVDGVYQTQVVNYSAGENNITMPVNRSYRFQFGKTTLEVISPSEVNASVFSLSYIAYTDKTLTKSGKSADAKVTGEKIEDLQNSVEKATANFVPLNTFDKTLITENSYLDNTNGAVAPLNGFFASDFCDVHTLDNIGLARTHIVCFYDENKNFVSSPSDADSRYDSKTVTRPSNAYYLRFSTNNEYLDSAQVGYMASLGEYHPYGSFVMPSLVTSEAVNHITVALDGTGDYTSFTEAIYDTVDSGIDVIVKPGTYDIRAEYEALFGADVVANLSDSTDLNGFQYGIALRSRKITFETGAKLVCDWTGITVDGAHRFSPVRVDYDVEIEGMNLGCVNTFYAIHDDYGLLTKPYTVHYKNCVVNAENLIQQNVIGGGCKKYSRHIIENCYFNNGANSNIHTARYHNTNQADAVPEIYVSNTYFNGTFTARWYGTQTTKMKVYVNNCKARAIYTVAEASGYDEQNIDLYKWCCEETNPIT